MFFRQSYKLVSRSGIQWFPGHMEKGIKQIEQKFKNVDCIIEVHDARIPYSGRNTNFKTKICGSGVKPYILVLNKKDLVSAEEQRSISKDLFLRENIKNLIFTNCKDHSCRGLKQLLPLTKALVQASSRYNRANAKELSVMIVGVPNVGKSSLINGLRNLNLRKKGATQVGALAGVTKSVLERIKICDDPLTYMIDTPGILEPRVTDDEMGLKLALVGCLPDKIVSPTVIADYLLYWMNRNRLYTYVDKMFVKEPTDNIGEVLVACANKLGIFRKIKQHDGQVVIMPDVQMAAKHFLKLYRRGELGHMNLDKYEK